MPVSGTNALIVLSSPTGFRHILTLGTLNTKDYFYNFAAGTTVSGVDYKGLKCSKYITID
jgi:hypothetical protein